MTSSGLVIVGFESTGVAASAKEFLTFFSRLLLFCRFPLLVDFSKSSSLPGIHLGFVNTSLSSFIRIYSVNEM